MKTTSSMSSFPFSLALTCSPACQNGGECIGTNVCLCPDGYSGATCTSCMSLLVRFHFLRIVSIYLQ